MLTAHWHTSPVLEQRARRFVSFTLQGKQKQGHESEAVSINANELEGLLDRAQSNLVFKDDRTTTVAQVRLGNEVVILKRYNPRSQWHKLKRALRKSRARNCWDMSFAFQRAGLNVSPPILMFEKRFGLVRQTAFFANEKLHGVELLSALPEMDAETQQQVRKAVLSAFDKLAEGRISHGDMKATNLLWVNETLFFIDLDAAQKHGAWSLTWKRKHAKDKRRFLKNWQDHPSLQGLFKELA